MTLAPIDMHSRQDARTHGLQETLQGQLYLLNMHEAIDCRMPFNWPFGARGRKFDGPAREVADKIQGLLNIPQRTRPRMPTGAFCGVIAAMQAITSLSVKACR